MIRDATQMRAARDRFSSTGEIVGCVRASIARSWLRTAQAGVVSHELVEPPFDPNFDPEGALLRAARPAVDRVTGDLLGSYVSMSLTDRHARVLARWAGNAECQKALDAVFNAPGFFFAEQYVGTTALGTAVEDACTTTVVGDEHFVDHLRHWTCVGVPVVHPLTRRLEGIVDVGCRSRDTSAFMVPLVERVASEIGQNLVTGYAGRDRQLLMEYLRVERRGPRRSVFALNERIFIANVEAGQIVGRKHQDVLWEEIKSRLLTADGDVRLPLLKDQSPVRVRPVRDADGLIGAVIDVGRSGAEERRPLPRASAALTREAADVSIVRSVLPGGSALWEDALRRAVRGARAGGPLLLLGEAGTGKQTLARALCGLNPQMTISVHSASETGLQRPVSWLRDVGAAMELEGCLTLITHLELTSGVVRQALCERLSAQKAGAERLVVGTWQTGDAGEPGSFLTHFAHTVELPPLRYRKEDTGALAEMILRELAGAPSTAVTPEAMRSLTSRDWPGNVRELRSALIAARGNAPGSWVRTVDLPAEHRGVAHSRTLTYLEQLELDAIMMALRVVGGNKQLAAETLGISRATLYRRLRACRIST